MEVKHDNDASSPSPMLSPAGAAELSERAGKMEGSPLWQGTGEGFTAAAAVATAAAGSAGGRRPETETTVSATSSPSGSTFSSPSVRIGGVEAEASSDAFEAQQKKEEEAGTTRLTFSPGSAEDVEVSFVLFLPFLFILVALSRLLLCFFNSVFIPFILSRSSFDAVNIFWSSQTAPPPRSLLVSVRVTAIYPRFHF